MQKLSQRDSRWASQKLGFSTTTTIGSHGCTITCTAMLASLTPDSVNNRLKAVGGYANTNLIIWTKIKEAISWLQFEWRGYSYENDRVTSAISKNGGCLVEVDGTPIGGTKHWVVYIGNQKLIDPWDGKEKPTSSYKATGYAVINKIGEQPEGSNMSDYEEAIRKAVAYDEVCKLLKQPTTTSKEVTVKKLSEIISDKERYLRERNEARVERNNYAKEVTAKDIQINLLKKDITALNNELENCSQEIPGQEDLEQNSELNGWGSTELFYNEKNQVIKKINKNYKIKE